MCLWSLKGKKFVVIFAMCRTKKGQWKNEKIISLSQIVFLFIFCSLVLDDRCRVVLFWGAVRSKCVRTCVCWVGVDYAFFLFLYRTSSSLSFSPILFKRVAQHDFLFSFSFPLPYSFSYLFYPTIFLFFPLAIGRHWWRNTGHTIRHFSREK